MKHNFHTCGSSSPSTYPLLLFAGRPLPYVLYVQYKGSAIGVDTSVNMMFQIKTNVTVATPNVLSYFSHSQNLDT